MVKFWKSHNWGMGCPIDMERKGCESTECRTHVVTINFDITYDIDLEFSMSNFEIAVSQECDGRLTWNERDNSGYGVIPTLWHGAMTLTLTSPMTLTLDFLDQIFNSHIWGMGRSIDLEWKRCELDTMLYAQWACFGPQCMAKRSAK